jgi:pimeloyl-ACP methyl ester carboxylesterase
VNVDIPLAAADGIRLVARRRGRGVPVVLVHGSAGGLGSWDPVAPLLADAFEVWVYARRGYAPSDDCRGAKTFAEDVADLSAVLDAAGGRAHVVGASYGATVALHAARRGVAGIVSVTLFEPPLFAAGARLVPVLDRYRALVSAGELTSASRLFAAEVARIPSTLLDALTPAEAATEDAARAAAQEAVGCLHDLEAMAADEPDVARWGEVRVPARLVQGSDTWSPMPATMQALADALPQASRVTLAGQSHFATHTAPDLFAGAVRAFLPAPEG